MRLAAYTPGLLHAAYRLPEVVVSQLVAACAPALLPALRWAGAEGREQGGQDVKVEAQRQLIRRIQRDLRHEANRHRQTRNLQAATDCDEQADALDCVVRTLNGMAMLVDVWRSLTTEEGET